MSVQKCLIPIYRHDGAVIARRPNGALVHVKYLIEGLHADGERLIDAAYTAENPRQISIQTDSGHTIRGSLVDLDDIVGWAVENGYLEARGDKLTTDQEGVVVT